MKNPIQKKPDPAWNVPGKKTMLRAMLLGCAVLVLSGGLFYGLLVAAENRARPSKNPSALRAATKDQTPGEVQKNVEYCNGQLLDLYEPRNVRFERSPVVVYIHGGGWVLNDKTSEPDQLAMLDGLRDDGYSVVSLNYSKVPVAYYPSPVEESLCAIRFLRAHADKYYLNTDDIAVYGFSAGGYLAAAIGLLPDDSKFETDAYGNHSSRVDAVVTLAGLFDFTDGLTDGNRERIGRFLHGADPIHAEVMSHISTDDPSFLLVHGARDQFVPLEQDELLAAGLQQQGVPVERLVVEYAEHGLNQSGGDPRPTREEVKDTIAGFIRSELE